MDVSKYIYDYLMEYNIPVIVPELGCFTIVNKPSEVKDGVVVPPVKTVELDSENSTDDDVLTLYIAKKENITVGQSAEKIREFYNDLFIRKLSVDKKVTIDEFGVFTLNFGNIVFTPDANFFKDNYGLGDAFISEEAKQQPVVTPAPEPIPILPKTEPATPEPAVQLEPDVPPTPDTKGTQTSPDDNLFDTNDTTRFRENTERRRPAQERQRPAAQPNRSTKTAPPKSRQPQMKTGNFDLKQFGTIMFIVFVVLCIGGFGYYYLNRSYNTTGTTIVGADREAKPLHTDEPEDDTPNPEVEQTLDDATDKKKALEPVSTPQPVAQPKPAATQPKPEPVSIPAQASTGRGRYVLVIGSFNSQSAAETYGRTLQSAGISYEIVDAGNQRFRISVASFDDKAEATRQANQMKSRPYCENVWVARR